MGGVVVSFRRQPPVHQDGRVSFLESRNTHLLGMGLYLIGVVLLLLPSSCNDQRLQSDMPFCAQLRQAQRFADMNIVYVHGKAIFKNKAQYDQSWNSIIRSVPNEKLAKDFKEESSIQSQFYAYMKAHPSKTTYTNLPTSIKLLLTRSRSVYDKTVKDLNDTCPKHRLRSSH